MTTAKLDREAMKDLVRGIRSANETYVQVLKDFGSDASMDDLRKISSEHKENARIILNEAKAQNIDVPESSGVWGTWAEAVTGAAKVINKKMALKALREGEEHGLKQYTELQSKRDIPESLRNSLTAKLIPRQKMRIDTLNSMIDSM